MKFQPNANPNMTSYQGELVTDYRTLVQVFGPPDFGPDERGDKTTCEWCLEWDDGMITTIYDYKTKATPRFPYAWHIGGHDDRAVARIRDYFQINQDPLVQMVRDYEPEKA